MVIWENDVADELQDGPAHPFIADENVRAATDHADGNLVLVAGPHDVEQFVDVAGTDQILSRTADFHPRQRSQRLVTKRDLFEGDE